MARRMVSSRTLAAGVLLALAGPGLAACDSDEEEYVYQCAVEVDGQAQAVDCDDVQDDDRGGGFVYIHSYAHPVYIQSYPRSQVSTITPGQKLPAGGHRIGYGDAAAREQVGLPARGKVGNNTVKTNVVGKGGAPGAVGGRGGGSAGG